MAISFRFDDGSEIQINLESLQNPIFGGQGRIYFYQNYLIKVLPLNDETESIPRRFIVLKRVCNQIDPTVREYITYRGIPLSISVDLKNYFNFKTTDKALILLFNLLDGKDIFDYLKNEPPLSPKRRHIYQKTIKILTAINNVGIIHGDLYPDNFIVSKNDEVYILDLEGAGILLNRREWEWKPLVIGKEGIFPLPPEVKYSGEFTVSSDIWTGLYLVFFILTGIKPLDFLVRNDHKYLETIVSSIDKEVNSWPPALPDSLIKNVQRYQDFSTFYNSIFKKGKLCQILVRTYIKGYTDYSVRPSFEEIKQAIDQEIEDIQDVQEIIIEIKPVKTKPSDLKSNTAEVKSSTSEAKPKTAEVEPKTLESKTLESRPKTAELKPKSTSYSISPELEQKISSLPISTRGYVFKIINSLKAENIIDQISEKAFEKVIEHRQAESLVNTFIITKDIFLAAVLLKFAESEYYENFLKDLQTLSNIQSRSAMEVIQTVLYPIVLKYKNKNKKINDVHEDIFSEFHLITAEAISTQKQKEIAKFSNTILYFFSFICFCIPFILYTFQINYNMIAMLYPAFFVVFYLVFFILRMIMIRG
ncbi:MAG: lipopolysaccharide kinase InaA family protein [bacterium]